MGKVFSRVNRGRHQRFESLISLMIQDDEAVRVTNLEILRQLLYRSFSEKNIYGN